jgi:endonuclease/exonuclease/phosphatase family metal-dependent hydrolase
VNVKFNIISVVSVLSLFLLGSASDELLHQETSGHTITIASFNTLRLGRGAHKDLGKVATVLSAYDVIALQEVMSEDTLRKVRDMLTRTTHVLWEYVISARSLGRTTYKEYYAILFRTDRTMYTDTSGGIWDDEGDHFEREPFYATFKSGNFDYTIIVMHSDFDNSKKVMRKEARLLTKVFQRVAKRDSLEHDIILMGDFNLSADDEGWDSLKTIPTIRHLIPGRTQTTLSTSGGLSKAYDNIWIRNQFTNHEYADTANADYYYHSMFSRSSNPGLEARKKVSDHVPVWAKFRVDQPDDD